jgi:S-adenosylmethionine synthetase
MCSILIEAVSRIPFEQQRFELVERKGSGHPDTICDAIAEDVSLALCQAYLAGVGRVLHHNVDKALLIAGHTQPCFGVGKVLLPMRLVLGDRATAQYQGKRFDVAEIARASAVQWLRHNLRHLDAERHFVFQCELQQGSAELTDLFERETIGANDTSAAVGYAPLTETEKLVLAAERHLNSPAFKSQFPQAGEDIKVMGLRRGRELVMTVAMAFVDRYVMNTRHYVEQKGAMRQALQRFLEPQQRGLDRISVDINTLDNPARGAQGLYLTVLGTSAECGDSGEVGRGNRVNGVISMSRPASMEAAAGKNPVSHVCKIYSVLSHRLPHRSMPACRGWPRSMSRGAARSASPSTSRSSPQHDLYCGRASHWRRFGRRSRLICEAGLRLFPP